jgi:hypothetical protein
MSQQMFETGKNMTIRIEIAASYGGFRPLEYKGTPQLQTRLFE